MTFRPSTADGNGGRDHRVAEEEGSANDAENEDKAAPLSQRLLGENHERQDAAFALIVGAHQDQHVFDGDDENERPDQQGYDGKNVLMHIAAGARHMGQRFPHRIEG